MEQAEIVKFLILSGISLIIWFFKSQSDRRYREQREDKNQLDENTKNILENKINDSANSRAFDTYKETINGNQKKTDGILSEISKGIQDLNNKVQESMNFNQKQILDLRIDIEKRLNK